MSADLRWTGSGNPDQHSGTPSSITTTFDGYPMAKRGEGERALKIGILSSFLGGMISLVCLWLFTLPYGSTEVQRS